MDQNLAHQAQLQLLTLSKPCQAYILDRHLYSWVTYQTPPISLHLPGNHILSNLS